ncbi:MAG: dynamin family protein [Lachnospiraceae bacterium]|nr:dynamin family protein [Lachnospiraceae bacterium]
MQVLIKSNPYKKEVLFYRRTNENEEWKIIQDSVLASDSIKTGFLTFKVEIVLDRIISLYQNDKQGKIKLFFEGPEDEYDEIEDAIKMDDYNNLSYSEYLELYESGYYLENASDILPDILRIYNERISYLIKHNLPNQIEIQEDLEKFSEASSSVIPVCVIGNYSTGKSTFINALIGREVLPSADIPVTAKYFKISDSMQSDKASILFSYNNRIVNIRFDSDGYKFIEGKEDNKLIYSIISTLDELKDANMYTRINKTINILNSYDKKESLSLMSDLISITVPFGDGLLGNGNGNFTIIDTPGSNSASNLNHIEVLRTAMKGLTNGIPIFVSVYKQLDTKDNEKLFNEILSMEEIDNRFTIIAVNQADEAILPKGGFSEEDINEILAEAVPRNLYSEGIYFVSSIMGLGAKNGGDFFDEGYAEVYFEKKGKFENKESKFYKQLYKYNIIPKRMKIQSNNDIDKEDNLMWVNSGLYSIEREIREFANKYSPYNKCQQSKLFLSKVIDISKDQLTDLKEIHINNKARREDELEIEKKQLIETINAKSEELKNEYDSGYISPLSTIVDARISEFLSVDIKAKEAEFEDKNKDINMLSQKEEEHKNAKESISDSLSNNAKKMFWNLNRDTFKNFSIDISEYFEELVDGMEEIHKTKKKIDNETANDLIKHMDELYNKDSIIAQNDLYNTSIEYWNKNSEIIRNELVKIVRDTDALNEDEREILSGIIINFEKIELNVTNDIVFVKTDFNHAIRIFNRRVEISDKLKLDKLYKDFSFKLSENIDKIKSYIMNEHRATFNNWLEDLNEIIVKNIVELNPSLHLKNDQIQEEANTIHRLEGLMNDLDFHYRRISEMMEWKEED